MICGLCQEPTSYICVPGAHSFASFSTAAAKLECHHRGQLVNALASPLPQPSPLHKCQLTRPDTDGEQKHRTGDGRERPTGVRKQEDSTHTVQERILPDNIINSFIFTTFISICFIFSTFFIVFYFFIFFNVSAHAI